MSSFFSRILRSEKRPESNGGQGRENRKRHSPSVHSSESVSEKSASLDKQQRVQEYQLPIFQPDSQDEKSRRRKERTRGGRSQSADRAQRKRKKQKGAQGRPSAFSSLFCMSGNSDTLERMPAPTQRPKDPPTEHKKPMKIGGSVSDKVVKRQGKKLQKGKFRHSAPALAVMVNGIEDEVAQYSEVGRANDDTARSPRESCSSPVQYRFDGTLQRPYVFPGGLTFLAGARKNGKQYCISPDKVDPAEKAKCEAKVDVHDGSGSPSSLTMEMPLEHEDGRTSWVSVSPGRQGSNRLREEDVRKQFTLKYDDGLSSSENCEPPSTQQSTIQDNVTAHFKSQDQNLTRVIDNSVTESAHAPSFPLRKGVSLEILNDTPNDQYPPATSQLSHSNSGRYSLPQGDPSCVYMGSFENLALLTLQRNSRNRASKNESEYFKSKQNLLKKGKKCHYSLPTLNHDFVCMGTMDDMNLPTNTETGSVSSDDDTPSHFHRNGLGRCSTSMPDLSKRLEYTIFDLPPVLSDSDMSSDSEDEDVKNGQESLTKYTEQSESQNSISHPLKIQNNSPLSSTGDYYETRRDLPSNKSVFKGRLRQPASPFSRNLGRASCMPGNKRFFIPPPPCYTPPKDDMASVQRSLSKLSCTKGSQTDLSVDGLTVCPDMEDRDNSLKRSNDVRRLSSSFTEGGTDSHLPLSLPIQDGSGNVDMSSDIKHTKSCDAEEQSAMITDFPAGDIYNTGSGQIDQMMDRQSSPEHALACFPTSVDHDHLQTSVDHDHLQTSVNHDHLQTLVNHDHLQTSVNHDHLQTSVNHDHLQTSVDHDHLQTSVNHAHLQTSVNHDNLQTLVNTCTFHNTPTTSTHGGVRSPYNEQLTEETTKHVIAITSTPKSSRKNAAHETTEKSIRPSLPPKPVPRQRKSLLKSKSMCINNNTNTNSNNTATTTIASKSPTTDHDTSSDTTTARKPVPRKRSTVRHPPRPRSEIIVATALSDYLKDQQVRDERTLGQNVHTPHPSQARSDPYSSPNSGATVNGRHDISIPPDQSNGMTDDQTRSDTRPFQTISGPSSVSSAPPIPNPHNTIHEEARAVLDEHSEQRHSLHKDLAPSPMHASLVHKHIEERRGTGTHLATPGPIRGNQKSYRMAIERASLVFDTLHQAADSSASNDEDVELSQGDTVTGSQEEDQCVADDEMSTGEEDATTARPTHLGGNILRGGSILDRSLILANKHRQRMAERKRLDQTETDDPDLDPNSNPSAPTHHDPRAVRKAVSFANCAPQSANNWINKSADSGTFSDLGASPSTSPVNPNSPKVSFAAVNGAVAEDADDIDPPIASVGVKRQISVQKKSWEVRLRRKHWMRKAGGRDHVQSWHGGPVG